jgi:hypothetical protein
MGATRLRAVPLHASDMPYGAPADLRYGEFTVTAIPVKFASWGEFLLLS